MWIEPGDLSDLDGVVIVLGAVEIEGVTRALDMAREDNSSGKRAKAE